MPPIPYLAMMTQVLSSPLPGEGRLFHRQSFIRLSPFLSSLVPPSPFALEGSILIHPAGLACFVKFLNAASTRVLLCPAISRFCVSGRAPIVLLRDDLGVPPSFLLRARDEIFQGREGSPFPLPPCRPSRSLFTAPFQSLPTSAGLTKTRGQFSGPPRIA